MANFPRSHVFYVIVVLLVAACVPNSGIMSTPTHQSEEQTARDALLNFFTLLNEGNYDKATGLYGGTYDNMRNNNLSVPETDLATLLLSACEINGIQCLKPKTITLEKATSSGDFLFQVEFQNQDGSLFVRGPCCGANPTDQPPQSSFDYEVTKDPQGQFLVMNMPPYVP